MNEEAKVPLNELIPEGLRNRFPALFDLWYIFMVINLIYFSLLPFFGIIMGIILIAGGATPLTKKWGKICLIIGIIATLLCIIFIVIFAIIAAAGLGAATRGYY